MIHVSKIMDEALLRKMIDEKFINKRNHPNLPLSIYSYSDKAVYSKEWNEATLNCRGLILDDNGYVLARPWKKFFNWGERRILIDGHSPVEVTEKLDGSLGILFSYNGQEIISTRGSFESEQALHAQKLIDLRYTDIDVPDGHTFLFEIIYKENRIVLDYGDMDELVLLGAVNNYRGFYIGPNEAAGYLSWTGEIVATLDYPTFADCLSVDRGPGHEGIVVRSGSDMVKIKQADYIELHRIISNLSPKSVWEGLREGKTPETICANLPDEFHSWVQDTSRKFLLDYLGVQGWVWEEFNRLKPLVSKGRKYFAQEASKLGCKGMLFALLDGKDIDPMIWDWVWDSYKRSLENK